MSAQNQAVVDMPTPYYTEDKNAIHSEDKLTTDCADYYTEEEKAENAINSEGAKSSSYFADYTNLDVHKIMLNDQVRTSAYYNAIVGQEAFFKDKIVLDVGCGTGILSLFCAKAGAKKIYAVDGSYITDLAKDIVKANNFEHVIEVIHSTVEDLTLPDNIKVDIIVSEWMGFYLLHEGMLDSVIRARDMFLKEDGRMFPELATIYLAPCSVPSSHDQWDEFYGLVMTPFAKKLVLKNNKKPGIDIVPEKELIGAELEIASFNLKTVKCDDINRISFKTVTPATRDGNYQGLCIWWQCTFPTIGDVAPIVLSTSPRDPGTHWKQCVLVLPYSVEVEQDEPIAFQFNMYRRNEEKRSYKIEYYMEDPDKIAHPIPCNCYKTTCLLAKAFLTEMQNNVVDNELEEEDITDITEDTESSNQQCVNDYGQQE